MAKISPRTTWRLARALRGKRSKPSRNDGVAVVTQVDRDGTRWVRMPGASMDTPVNGEMVANAAVGESVSYRVEDGRLSITGNASDPAMGVAAVNATVGPVAEAVESVRGDVSEARSENETTMRVASEARDVANATNQNFWTDTDGVHVTEVTQDDWKDSEGASYHSGPNMLINSVGQLLRNGLNNLVSITSSAIAFYDGLGNAANNIVARFGGDGIRIGRSTESNVQVDYHSMRMVDKSGLEYLHVSDLRDGTGYATVKHPVYGDGSTRDFAVSMPATSTESVTVDGVAASYTYSNQTYHLTTAPADGALVLITYKTNVNWAKAFTFGIRNSDTDPATGESYSAIGPYSAVFGSECIADGYCSFAAGRDSYAHGQSSVAMGEAARAYDGAFAAAGGKADHGSAAFGGEATGGTSFAACSAFNEAKGLASSVFGHGTIASGDYQTALGMFNVEDTNGDFALIVGNGADEENRSNAFTVDWDGIMSAGLKSDTIDINTSTIRSTNTNTIHSNGVCCSVTLNVRNNAAIANGSNIVVGTVPEGFRPPQTIYSACSANNAAGMGCYMTLGVGGVITCYNRSGSSVAANTALAATFTYAL